MFASDPVVDGRPSTDQGSSMAALERNPRSWRPPLTGSTRCKAVARDPSELNGRSRPKADIALKLPVTDGALVKDSAAGALPASPESRKHTTASPAMPAGTSATSSSPWRASGTRPPPGKSHRRMRRRNGCSIASSVPVSPCWPRRGRRTSEMRTTISHAIARRSRPSLPMPGARSKRCWRIRRTHPWLTRRAKPSPGTARPSPPAESSAHWSGS